MNVIKFPDMQQKRDKASNELNSTESVNLRDFALKVAAQLRNDSELNSQAPYLVDKVIMLLIKESRHLEK